MKHCLLECEREKHSIRRTRRMPMECFYLDWEWLVVRVTGCLHVIVSDADRMRRLESFD